ncbi:ABC transporter permease [Bacteroidota bacterium]
MFKIDVWQEIFATMRKNKLRSFLTGFSVSWGIFMLVLLLGAGNGFINGTKAFFDSAKLNSMWIFGNRTSMPYKGYKENRRVQLTNEDYYLIKEAVEEVDLISSRYQIPYQGPLSRNGKYGTFEIRTVFPDYLEIENIKMMEGRFINNMDIEQNRKITVISTDVQEFFFKDENPIGEYIRFAGIPLQIVGVFEDKDSWDNNKCIYFPVSTAQTVFGSTNDIWTLSLTIHPDITVEQSKIVAQQIRRKLAKLHDVHPKDERGIYIGNSLENYKRQLDGIKAINIVVWIIGIGTIIAGIVGISNIMLIVVKERTKEIGVRKAIGARPSSITGMIIQESILITTISGFGGLMGGVLLLELINKVLPDFRGFKNPEADITIALSAVVVLIIAGTFAGYIPAKKASKIKPIVALRDE